STHGTLQADVEGIVERLNTANGTFQQAMGNVVGSLTQFEGGFADQVKALESSVGLMGDAASATLGQMDAQVQTLRTLTQGALKDIAGLTTRFEEQGRLVRAASETLGQSHEQVDQTLTNRRVAIEQLAASLTERVQDLDDRLQGFHGTLEQSLQTAQKRAREIAAIVADSASSSSKALESQMERMRTSSDAERERMMQALTSTYQSALTDVNGLFEDTGRRFNDVARELKGAAQEVQQSIELAREEMKRGILELPAETEASAATMRRAVAEQIKALAELNEIVARQGQSADVAAPAGRVIARENAPVGASRDPIGRDTTVRDTAVREARREPVREAPREARPEPVPPARTRSEPPSVPVGPFEPNRRPASRRPEPAPERAQDPRPATRAPQQRENEDTTREGWLSELLARASGDLAEAKLDPKPEPVRPAPRPARERPHHHTIESLDSLSVDIARMIDHQAAVELWERYKRGERNVFTRKLYTMQGQQTFEELRRKYRSDAEFHEIVDRYVAEFERLLDQVAADDRGNVLTKTYLTSDTGKVYTMLAHAAGRFD
ncbi:MAG: hypothetical protein B7Z45_02045, partial [Azorhizobium sp. 12-66-6]